MILNRLQLSLSFARWRGKFYRTSDSRILRKRPLRCMPFGPARGCEVSGYPGSSFRGLLVDGSTMSYSGLEMRALTQAEGVFVNSLPSAELSKLLDEPLNNQSNEQSLERGSSSRSFERKIAVVALSSAQSGRSDRNPSLSHLSSLGLGTITDLFFFLSHFWAK